jgi:hypothetical protein
MEKGKAAERIDIAWTVFILIRVVEITGTLFVERIELFVDNLERSADC